MGKVIDTIVLVLYPVLVVVGLTYFGVRWTALVLFLLLGRRLVGVILTNREGSRVILYQAVAVVTIAGVAAASGSPFVLRIAPFIISLSFIVLFAVSLGTVPLIERFARLKRPDLSEGEVVYCRKLTQVWVGILMANSCLVAVAAFIEDHALWTLIVGPVSYTFLGLVFVVEYPYRKWRFQDFDQESVLDRFLARFLARQN